MALSSGEARLLVHYSQFDFDPMRNFLETMVCNSLGVYISSLWSNERVWSLVAMNDYDERYGSRFALNLIE